MNWLVEGLKAIANGLPTHTASKVAKDLLARIDAKYDPIMDAPPMTRHAVDMPHPWQPFAVPATGQRGYKHPDGRYACGIHRDRYHEVLGTHRAEAVARLVHANAHLYIEADSEADLIAKVATFEKAWNEVQSGDWLEGVHCTAHVQLDPASAIPPRPPKRLMRTRNATKTNVP